MLASRASSIQGIFKPHKHTVDGGNLAPPKVPKVLGITVLQGVQVVQDIIHQQYSYFGLSGPMNVTPLGVGWIAGMKLK